MNFIDISHHQGNIDFKKVVTDVFGPKLVYIKATQGVNFTDSLFLKNANAARAAGLKIGYYHFASLNNKNEVDDAKTEALWFIKNVKLAPQFDFPLVLDIEENPAKLSKDEVIVWINTFFYTLNQAGFNEYMLYSYTPFLNSNLPLNHKLGNIKLWIAAYNPSYKIPNGWKSVAYWQYSQTGKISGISGNVDLNKTI